MLIICFLQNNQHDWPNYADVPLRNYSLSVHMYNRIKTFSLGQQRVHQGTYWCPIHNAKHRRSASVGPQG